MAAKVLVVFMLMFCTQNGVRLTNRVNELFNAKLQVVLNTSVPRTHYPVSSDELGVEISEKEEQSNS